MGIAISFDPTDASDVEYITNLLNEPEAEEAPAKAAPKTRAKAKAAPEPEPADDDTPEGPTLEDAIAKAQELVGEGRAAEVKGALANLGVKKVTELEESQYAEFIEALSEDSVV